MSEQEEVQFKEELKRKVEEARRRSFEDESRKVAREAEERALQTTKARSAEETQANSKRLHDAQEERRRQEAALKSQEEEVVRKLRTEAAKKTEARNRQEMELKRKEEEEKRRREDEERRNREEQERARREEERRKIVDAERKRADAEREKREHEARKKEEERIRKEEESKSQAHEREERIKSLVARAQVFFEEGDLEHASVEAAKALVNDPNHPEALELERRIKEAQGKKAEDAAGTRKKARKARPVGPEKPPITSKRKPYAPALMMVAFVAIVIVSVLVVLEVRKSTQNTVLSVAVLPWSSGSDVVEENVMGSSLAEETAGRLSDYKSMIVMDFASAYTIARNTREPEQAAFRLGFRYAVMGTITRSPKGFAFAVNLVDSVRNTLWSSKFEIPPESLAIVSRELPRQIAGELGSSPPEPQDGFTPVRALPNAEAYMLYLRGLELLHRCTKESTQNALELLQQAIQQDGSFAEAMAAAGNVMAERVERGWDAGDSSLAQAKELALQSLTLDPSVSEGHRALGNVLSQRKDFRTALSEFDTAQLYAPRSGRLLGDRARALLQVGEYREALTTLGHAYELSPRDPELLLTYAFAQRLNGAVRQSSAYQLIALQCAGDSAEYLLGPFADAVELDPELSSTQNDRVAAAFRLRLKARPDDAETMYRFARLLQVTGKRTQASELLSRAESLIRAELKKNPRNARAMMNLALTLTRQGKFPEASDLAQRAGALEKSSPELRYRAAQMYSLQMYSLKEKKIDPKAKENALQALKQAVGLGYRLDELANADFFNLSDQPEFKTAIEQSL